MTEFPTKNKGAKENLHTVFVFARGLAALCVELWMVLMVLMVLASLRSESESHSALSAVASKDHPISFGVFSDVDEQSAAVGQVA